MLLKCVLCVFLSVYLVSGSVSFRKSRGAQWQPQRPYNGSANIGAPWQQPAQPYYGSITVGEPNPNIRRGFNITGPFTTRTPQHLPGYRPPPTYQQTYTPGAYQPTYNQTRPVANHPSYPQNSQHPQYPQQPQNVQPRFGNEWNSTRNLTSPRLYPDLSNRFGSAGAVGPPSNVYPHYGVGGGNVNPLPAIRYQPYGSNGQVPNVNPSYPSYNYNATQPNQPSVYPSEQNVGVPYQGSQQPNPGVNTWGHPNYQSLNATRPTVPSYYNPRNYS